MRLGFLVVSPFRIAGVFLHVERGRSSKRVWRSPRIIYCTELESWSSVIRVRYDAPRTRLNPQHSARTRQRPRSHGNSTSGRSTKVSQLVIAPKGSSQYWPNTFEGTIVRVLNRPLKPLWTSERPSSSSQFYMLQKGKPDYAAGCQRRSF
jgi:hypothetical protein